MILQDKKILEAHTKVEEKKLLYAPNNILPLDLESGKKAIMRYPGAKLQYKATLICQRCTSIQNLNSLGMVDLMEDPQDHR
ncbi:hypothetical protein PIB30_079850 [Stylosanthes scabra]|uniref:DNA-directed RNA polymerase n=1 Tax=Stylosanthes scabra TaxID=79078 RepID=A0ABU6YQ15_9FABA|nr:hypothetical protein [Stylosanthes scabra]